MSGSTRLTPRAAHGFAIALLVLAPSLAYLNSFGGPFVFDDLPSIPGNPTLRHLWPPGAVLSPPQGQGLTVEGRPLLNLSFAINHAIGGHSVGGYHAVNLLIHLGATLALFALVRRTLTRLAPSGKPAGIAPLWPAFAAAALWSLHPLNTESVTYIVQRAESLMGLCYLLTLLGFVRAVEAAERADPTAARRACLWSVLCCALGMAVKESMVSAPLLVLLYDRTWVSGSVRAAWRARRGYYLALGATWLLPLGLLLRGGARGGTAGLDAGVSVFRYALTQCEAIVHYLQLAFWPHPLVFDYGIHLAENGWKTGACAGLLLVLLFATVQALRQRQPAGFLGAFFFGVLAPSSSVVPIATQTMAEHRMYLPLAAVAIVLTLALQRVGSRQGLMLAGALALAGGFATHARNRTYRSELALHWDTAYRRPENFRAHYNVGAALARLDRAADALPHFEAALRLSPGNADVHDDFGNALLQLGRSAEAISHYRLALRAVPDHTLAHTDLGNALLLQGDPRAAVDHYEAALRTDPALPGARFQLARALSLLGRPREAIPHYEQLLASPFPPTAAAYYGFANALFATDRLPEAIAAYEHALRLQPDHATAAYNLGNTLARAGRLPEAIARYRQALRTQPDDPDTWYNLGTALLESHQLSAAIAAYEAALRARPDFAEARASLLRLRQSPGPAK